jgi:nucleotide-binding universal stress UspA family protein
MSLKLLLPVDGSAASLQAARMVAGWRGERARVVPVLLNVQTPPLKVSPEAGIDHTLLEDALRAQGAAELEPAAAILREAGLEPETAVRLGRASDTIADAARETNADLIVMGTRGHGALSGFALGSVALRVVQRARLPVVLVKPDARLPPELGRRLRVVAPLDGSEWATRAVRRVAVYADLFGELHLDLVHFQAPLTYIEAVMPPHDDVLRRWSGLEAEEAVAGAKQALADAGIAHRVHGVTGDPSTGIAQFAHDREADLIVMSARGIGTLRHLVIGSVALKTAHLSHVPVVFMPSWV